jgi:GR25 family glycosyltransferase involved in LPS biosynthesis
MNFKIIVINLKKDSNRINKMISQFKKLDISFDRFEAINPRENKEVILEYDNKKSLQENGKELNLGEIGCALSHKRVTEIFLEENKKSGLEYVLICEDDIVITDKNFKKILEEEVSKNKISKKPWEYLQFDYDKPGLWWMYVWFVQVIKTFKLLETNSSKIKHLLFSIIKIPFVFVFAFYEGLRNTFYVGPASFNRDVYVAGCYMINISGAKKLLSLSEKIIYPADKLQNAAKKKIDLKVKYYCPNIVHQDRTFQTNIGR